MNGADEKSDPEGSANQTRDAAVENGLPSFPPVSCEWLVGFTVAGDDQPAKRKALHKSLASVEADDFRDDGPKETERLSNDRFQLDYSPGGVIAGNHTVVDCKSPRLVQMAPPAFTRW